jgi:hypothetical protein
VRKVSEIRRTTFAACARSPKFVGRHLRRAKGFRAAGEVLCHQAPLLARAGEVLCHQAPLLARAGEVLCQQAPLLARAGEVLCHQAPLLARAGEVLCHQAPPLARAGEKWCHLAPPLARAGESVCHLAQAFARLGESVCHSALTLARFRSSERRQDPQTVPLAGSVRQRGDGLDPFRISWMASSPSLLTSTKRARSSITARLTGAAQFWIQPDRSAVSACSLGEAAIIGQK